MSTREAPNFKELGPKKYKERIHRESKFADDNKNLPFKFSKPKKKGKPENIEIVCSKCERSLFVNEDAVLVFCGVCNTLNRVRDRKVK